MRLFVDDKRPVPKWGYECARTFDQAILLLSLIEFEHISLDYSLGDDCKTGLDILVWMQENGVRVPEINIHSDHVIGKEKMREFCEKVFPDTKVTRRPIIY